MDGEFDIESSEHLITAVKSGGELKNCWAQYHLIGDALRGDIGRGEAPLRHDFSNRVMAALEAEPTIFMPKNQNIPQVQAKKSGYKSTKLWSVAASFAAIMFVSVMVFQQQINAPKQPTIEIAQAAAPVETLAPVEIAQSVPTEYLQAHQAAAPSGTAYYIQNASYTESQQ
jgi:sigma-E factor negative regulatory protein RseA